MIILSLQSIWNKYFCDQELKRFIRLDVTRTSTDRNLSQLPNVHDRLVEILFLYARQNPDICYRQVNKTFVHYINPTFIRYLCEIIFIRVCMNYSHLLSLFYILTVIIL